ncbi:MAG TPA: DNA-binding response regulator, partial [Spongiibacteraceae bacterium]|nr:DNA-binding response regulator [Spongiibacteraceae bacterium]
MNKQLVVIQRADRQRDELLATLEHLDYEVRAFADEQEGLAAFLDGTPDAVLLDLYV